MKLILDKLKGKGSVVLDHKRGRIIPSLTRGTIVVTSLKSPIVSVGLDPSYQALLDYALLMGYAIPSEPVQTLQNAWVVEMKTLGAWDSLDVVYNTVGDGDSNFARLNWKAPALYPIPAGGTYEKFKGIDSTTSAITMSTPTWSNFTLSDAGIIGDYQVAPSGDFFPLFGWTTGTRTSIRIPRQAPPRFDAEFFDNTATQYTIIPLAQTQIQFHLQRIGTSKKAYEYGVLVGNTTLATGGLPSGSFTMVPGIRGATLRMLAMGASLTGAELAVYNAWSTYMTGINPLRADYLYTDLIAFAALQGYGVPSSTMQAAGEALILELITADIWDQLDAFYVFKTNGDASFAKINWKNRTLGAMATGGGSFVSMDGLDISSTLTYNYTPSTAGNKWSLNEASFFSDRYDKRAAGSAVSGNLVSNTAVQGVNASWFDSAPNLYVQFTINDQSAKNGIIGTDYTTAVDWVTHVQRFYSGSSSVIRDGVTRSANFATASVAVPTVSLQSGPDANQRKRFFGAGSSLAGREAALVTALTNYKAAT